MFVSTRANVVIAKPPEQVFDLATDSNRFHEFFTGWGPVAGNLRVEQLDKGKQKAGSRRRVINKDGAVILEEIHQLTRPVAHRYRVLSGLPQPLALLVKYGDATWRFRAVDSGTSLTWEYKFAVINIAAAPAVAGIVKVPMQRAMQRCLNNMRDELESGEL